MPVIAQVAYRRQALSCALVGLILAGLPFAASAQQAGGSGSVSTQTSPLGIAVEYATIGGVQLPVQILRPDSATAVGAGQVASNRQVGTGNTTEIGQTGQGNRASVVAVGDYNTAVIVQIGRNNVGQGTLDGSGLSLNLLQRGDGNRAELGVTGGSGGSLTVRQFGDGNAATGSVPGTRDVSVTQSGNGLSADVSQVGVQKSISVIQVRTR